MQAQDALIFLHYAMFAVPLMLLMLVPVIITEWQTIRPQVAYAVSGFIVVGVQSHRAGVAYTVNYRRSWY